jgi:hypothetical protein
MKRQACAWLGLLGTALLFPAALRAEEGKDVEVLARGPVHEAFAEPVEQQPAPGPLVPKQPPAPLDELPPDQKPAGDNVIWLPGYWSWDAEREDYIWISGFWRATPPNRAWMPGSWRKVGEGWQWVSGFWNVSAPNQEQAQVEYLPEPPAPVEAGPVIPAPAPTSVYVPGVWVYRGARYVWRPGYWLDYRAGWIWIPAHYRWTPAGYVFIDGYWDYPLADRGMLFAPAYVPSSVYVTQGYYYTPTVVVRDQCMFGALFVRRGYGCYYFGDYFGPTYATSGYVSWCGYSGGRDVVVVRGWYDPMYSYYRVTYRDDPGWHTSITTVYIGRFRGDVPPPPRTLVQQNNIFVNNTVVNNTTVINNKTVNVSNVQMLTTVNAAAKANPNLKLQPVPAEARKEQMVASRQVHTFAQQRAQSETQLVAKSPGAPKLADGPRTAKLDVPKASQARASSAAVPPTPEKTTHPTAAATGGHPGANPLTGKNDAHLPPKTGTGVTPKDTNTSTLPKIDPKTGTGTNPVRTNPDPKSGAVPHNPIIPPRPGTTTPPPKKDPKHNPTTSVTPMGAPLTSSTTQATGAATNSLPVIPSPAGRTSATLGQPSTSGLPALGQPGSPQPLSTTPPGGVGQGSGTLPKGPTTGTAVAPGGRILPPPHGTPAPPSREKPKEKKTHTP